VGLQLIGLILGIVALVQSKKAGAKNGMAVAAIIVSSVLIVIGIIVGIVVAVVFANTAGDLIQFCANNPSGVYELNGQTITCNGG
jgi:disulfide bond formation protein DsbB